MGKPLDFKKNKEKYLFYGVLAFTAISVGVAIFSACFFTGEPTAMQSQLFGVCADTWKIGLGTLVGLLSNGSSVQK